MKRIYFAGKVDHYRRELFRDASIMRRFEEKVELPNGSPLIYGGPVALGCDHGCWHNDSEAAHGLVSRMAPDSGSDDIDPAYDPSNCPVDSGLTQDAAVLRCLKQIEDADAVHAYIDQLDCIGTLSELGYASALQKPIHLVFDLALKPANPSQDTYEDDCGGHCPGAEFPGWNDEFWFIKKLPGVASVTYGGQTTINLEMLR